MNTVVVIPVFKSTLNEYESISFENCLKVLGKHPICLVCPESLELKTYMDRVNQLIPGKKDFKIERLSDFYFKNTLTYNKLMLSIDFYKKFLQYEFILIFQLDAYVFRDEVALWTRKNFDYVGGTWFTNFTGNVMQGADIWIPGNGGLSLRKTSAVINILNSRKRIYSFSELITRAISHSNIFKLIRDLLVLPLRLMGILNNTRFFAKTYSGNEDIFFAINCPRYNKKFYVPPIEDSVMFSWDRHPDFLYNKYKQLPFGCHGWYRNDRLYSNNLEFWKKYIKEIS